MPAKVAAKKGEAKKSTSKTTSKATSTESKPAAKPKGAAAGSTKKAASAAGKSSAEKDVTAKMAKLSTEEKAPPKPTVVDVAFKDIATVLKDEDGKIKASGKWPLLVDPAGRASVFFRYQGGNFMDTQNPGDMQSESIRRLLVGSLRYGKYYIIDFGDSEMFDVCAQKFDDVHKGLWDDLLDKSILEKFAPLIRDSDGPDYEEDKWMPHVTSEFLMVVLSKIEPAPKLLEKFYVMKVKMD